MKISRILLVPAAVSFIVAVSSCGAPEQKPAEGEMDATETPAANQPAEITDMTGVLAYYECPMKCDGKKYAGPGGCPVCGMDLVRVDVEQAPAEPADTAASMEQAQS
jgi:hypothetical protein